MGRETGASSAGQAGPLIRGLALAGGLAMVIAVFVGADSAGQVGLFPGPYLDKLAHAAYYGIVAVLFDVGLGRRSPLPALGIALLTGVTDEGHQLYVPGRDGAWQDAVADGVGALLAIGRWRWRRVAAR
jgi:hypothetical protein